MMSTTSRRAVNLLVSRLPIALAAAVLGFASGAASAVDAGAGKTKAQACAACHGLLGLSMLPDAPNIAGQPAVYVVNQLRAYRSGERRNEMMNLMAKPLSDADIDDLAAWFASIRIEAKAP